MTIFTGNHLNWPVERTVRTFTVRVIEPSHYEPKSHGKIFGAVLGELIAPTPDEVDLYTDLARGIPISDEFDLVTFPEAFLAANDLLKVLTTLRGRPSLGCVHVGLRPLDQGSHLFGVSELAQLTDDLIGLSVRGNEDLASFKEWLNGQRSDHRFNIGCLFAIDAKGELRVCLHPKLVRSKFERAPVPDEHMEEANFLTLITLIPTEKHFFSVTLQPLICSDALNISRDHPGDAPMKAVNTEAACFGDSPPDHIDIVSVATCTPQVEDVSSTTLPYCSWHIQFLDAFRATQSGTLPRHHFSTIVLSNFQFISERDDLEKRRGGLSGVFMPVPPSLQRLHQDVEVYCWGRPKDPPRGDNRWSAPDVNSNSSWSNKGFIATLNSEPQDVSVRVFGFTIHRLPRDNPRWDNPDSLTRCSVRVATSDENGQFRFLRRS